MSDTNKNGWWIKNVSMSLYSNNWGFLEGCKGLQGLQIAGGCKFAGGIAEDIAGVAGAITCLMVS